MLSVVIPTYNRKLSLIRALTALSAQELPAEDFEVVIVSDGSTDGTNEAVKGFPAPYAITLIDQANSGPSVARNRGAREAHSELIVYMDDDIEPTPAFLRIHAEAHADTQNLVLIGPQSMPPGERFPIWIAWEHAMLERQYVHFRAGEWNAGPNNLYSGNFSIRREHLLQVGGFNESFKRQEDVELGFRLEKLGLCFKFDHRANGFHRPDRTFTAWCNIPYAYGRHDIEMARDQGEDRAIDLARVHYKGRNKLTRLMARTCIGRGPLQTVMLGCLKTAIPLSDRIGMRKFGLILCSLLFNLRYLQGMCEQIGGARAMWRELGAI